MDAAHAAAAGGRRMEAAEKLLNSVTIYAFQLYVATIVAGLAPRVALKFAPEAVAAAASYASSNGYDVTVTAAVFATATVLIQGRLARVLERKPAPAPRLTALAAWPLAVGTWLSVTSFFLEYVNFGADGLMRRADWAVAAVASAANLAMAARTVSRHLA